MTFSAINDILKPRGILVLGWNDIEDLRPVPLDNIMALKKLKRYYFKPLEATKYRCRGEGRHTYNFYIKH